MITQLNKKQLKQFKNQSQTEYMQSNKPQIAGREAGKKNRTQIHSQSGRSMVEMLGVLAIIAILSIGGIVMFRYAMNYYQANQIAHEMNIMRTDAQIKIAQGTEKLILGSPYDPISESQLGHIQFNDDYPIDFACALADDKDVILGVDCHVANAYYIELQNIPEGVCKPLARLISGMDNLIDFYVNELDAEEENKDTCNEDFNTLTVIFGADSDSNAVKCDTNTECESSENTPFCNTERHVCVECTQEKGCEDESEHCKISTGECIVCEDGEEWNSEFEECVVISCLENSDCNKNGNNHYYCHFDDTNNCSKQAGYPGRCIDKDKDAIVIEGTDFISKKSDMSWWSAQNFCQANKKELANIVDLNCADSITPSSNGYCHQTKAGNTDYDPDNISNTVITLHATLGNHYFWLQEWYDEGCPAGGVFLIDGLVRAFEREHNNYVLCK